MKPLISLLRSCLVQKRVFYQSNAIMIWNKVLKKPQQRREQTPPCSRDQLAATEDIPTTGPHPAPSPPPSTSTPSLPKVGLRASV